MFLKDNASQKAQMRSSGVDRGGGGGGGSEGGGGGRGGGGGGGGRGGLVEVLREGACVKEAEMLLQSGDAAAEQVAAQVASPLAPHAPSPPPPPPPPSPGGGGGGGGGDVLNFIIKKYYDFIQAKNDESKLKNAGDFIAQKTPTCALMDPRIP